MGDIWFIHNPRSGGADDQLAGRIAELFAQAGRPIARTLLLGEDELPDADAVRAGEVELLVVLGGDGSLNAILQRLDGWDGALLPLPGGTMNLLATAVHGAADALDIVAACLADRCTRIRVPMITSGAITAYAGIIAGPTAAWGAVREDLRDADLGALGEDVVEAVRETFKPPSVTIKGIDGHYAAIYIEPGVDGLRASGVIADGAGDLLAHGWAWLMGDFRQGPFDQLPDAAAFTIACAHGEFDLLIDGERRATHSPTTFRAGRTTTHILSLRGRVDWA